MKYNQPNRYQNIEGGGRNCDDRWDVIRKFVNNNPDAVSLDVGSAEGVFSKRLANLTEGRVISIEGSDFVHSEQLRYCSEEISNRRILLHKMELNSDTLPQFVNHKYEYTLLLSVLHWCENPDEILKTLSDISEYVFVELPDLNDTKSYGQDYLKRIREDYTSIENYIQEVSGKPIIGAYKVEGNNSEYRVVYVLHKSQNTILVDTDDVYHLLHGDKNTVEGVYLSGDFKIVPIKNSPVVEYINGNPLPYNSQSKLFNKRENTIIYLLNEYEYGNRNWVFKAVFYKGKYIIADGMHRSSVLQSKGYRKIPIEIVSWTTEKTATFERFIKDSNFVTTPVVENSNEVLIKRIESIIDELKGIITEINKK